jgi:hypothetical protein
MQAHRFVCVPACEHTHTDTSVTVSLLSVPFFLRLCLCLPTLCLCFCVHACVCAFVLVHIRRTCRFFLCVQIFFHEFRDGLRRLETTPQIHFTAEDWNTHVISRGLAMTDGQLDMQVPHVCLVCNKEL